MTWGDWVMFGLFVAFLGAFAYGWCQTQRERVDLLDRRYIGADEDWS